MNIIVLGDKESGKSTLIGHALFKAGGIDRRTIDKYKAQSKDIGKESFAFAWVVDNTKTEREYGRSQAVNSKQFTINNRVFYVIGIPGHPHFIKNAIGGIFQGEAAIIVVAARQNDFDACLSSNGSLRQQCIVAKIFGISQVIVAVNKMDDIGNDINIFNIISDQVSKFLINIGYTKLQILATIPISALHDQNLDQKPTSFTANCPTLFESMCLFQKKEPRQQIIPLPFRFAVRTTYKIGGIGTVPVGVVISGSLVQGEFVRVFSKRKGVQEEKFEVKSIERFYEAINKVNVNDMVGMNLKGIVSKEIGRSAILSSVENPARFCERLTADIMVLNFCNAVKIGLVAKVDVGSQHVSCQLENILKYKVQKEPKKVSIGDVLRVILTPLKPLVVEKYADIKRLGEFVLRCGPIVVAGGKVVDIQYE